MYIEIPEFPARELRGERISFCPGEFGNFVLFVTCGAYEVAAGKLLSVLPDRSREEHQVKDDGSGVNRKYEKRQGTKK